MAPNALDSDGAAAAPCRVETLVTSHCAGEVWALAVHPFELKFATGGDDNSVRVFSCGPAVAAGGGHVEVARRVLAAEAGPDRKAGHGASTM